MVIGIIVGLVTGWVFSLFGFLTWFSVQFGNLIPILGPTGLYYAFFAALGGVIGYFGQKR